MTTPYLSADVCRDEGLRLTAYKDPAGVWTIGYGHTGLDVMEGLVWTLAQAMSALSMDLNTAIRDLDRELPWWRALSDVRQDVLANMSFNIGIGHLLGFTHTLAAIQASDWKAAWTEMLESKWAAQVGARADRLATQMLTGFRSTPDAA